MTLAAMDLLEEEEAEKKKKQSWKMRYLNLEGRR
jgi:hypothetical protein